MKDFDFDHIIDRRDTGSMKWDTGDKDLLPLWVADMDFTAPPAVIEALKTRVDHGIFGYAAPSKDLDGLLCGWLKRRHGWETDPEHYRFCPGVVPAVNILIQAMTQPGDKVILQTPVYYPFFEAVRNNGRQIFENPLAFDGQRYEMDFDDLEAKASDPRATLLVLCSPHNPVGRVWTREELERLGRICAENGVFVVADEIHCDLIHRGFRHVPFASLGDDFARNSATCVAPSKTFNLAGLQYSTVIIPDDKARQRFTNIMVSLGIKRSNLIGLAAAEAAYRDGEAWLEALLDYLGGNLALVRDFVKERLEGVRLIEPEGTYLAWLDFSGLGFSKEELEKLMLEKAKVWLDEGYIFGSGGPGFERVVLACPRKVLREALERIAMAFGH
jgi:cystathionine beta-lyase